ncbi:PadR family transcriptional regulator [Streptomyces sp. NPDC058000]|uniref:PadR family transcriptional regulator n=1 Tax=Streptomyces sp. NPDC058000 TaxID=3346299 RepID=UPI0036E9C8CF
MPSSEVAQSPAATARNHAPVIWLPYLAGTTSKAESQLRKGVLEYCVLAILRRDGLVETRWQESPSGPPRRYYELTPPGHAALKEFTAIWPHFRDAVDHFIAD